MKEGGAHAVKFEGGVRVAEQIQKVSGAGIPVMGHIGFTPQSEHQLGGYRVQGRGSDADRLLADAHAVADAGAFGMVLEMVPGDLARRVTAEVDIPTVGIGAGPDCDAQVLVWQDMVGLRRGKMSRFVKQYANLAQVLGRGGRGVRGRGADRRLPHRGAHLRIRAVRPSAGSGPRRVGQVGGLVRVARSLSELAEHRRAIGSDRVVHVPTMGALHAGHRSLIELAHTLGDRVVVSIFVNPLQFGPHDDYARYPRPVEDDLATCERLGVDLAFVPSVTDLYPAGRQVTVNAGPMGAVLEGAARPGHFDGVLTVVLKLMHLIRPNTVVFGQKDAQQLACVQRMVTDLNLDITVVGAPTVREPDGLALSSRNVFLNPADRGLAAGLAEAVRRAQAESTVARACAAAFAVLDRLAENPHFQLDYATVVNPATFAEVDDSYRGPAVFVLAARVGETRLIDNVTLSLSTVDEAPDA